MTTATMVCSWSSFIDHGKVVGGGRGTSEHDGGGRGRHCCQRKNSYPPSEGVCCQCSSLFVSGVVTSLTCIKKKLTFEKKNPPMTQRGYLSSNWGWWVVAVVLAMCMGIVVLGVIIA